jgi:ribosomal protein S18 acetylase RimI-like enzyme
LPRYPTLPAIRIGRLAIDKKFQKHGIGSILLFDAIRRALRAEMANYTLLVDAKNELAADFYTHNGFIRLENKPSTLFLPLETAAKLNWQDT